MKIKELIQQVEHLMGRQPEGYMVRYKCNKKRIYRIG